MNERDFKRVYQKGQKFSGSFFYGKFLNNRLPAPRFGIVVSLKVSKSAVLRNKIKRQIRAAILEFLKENKILPGRDIIINVGRIPVEKENPQEEIKKCLKNLPSN